MHLYSVLADSNSPYPLGAVTLTSGDYLVEAANMCHHLGAILSIPPFQVIHFLYFLGWWVWMTLLYLPHVLSILTVAKFLGLK